jgi:hypothetical protein
VKQRLAAFLLTTLVAGQAFACPEPSRELQFHSCWGSAQADLRLLPEELPLPPPPDTGQRLIVTGAYTGTEPRGEGLPNPVGLFVDGGAVINPNLGRMDGVLIINPATGRPKLHHRERLTFAGREYDLTTLDQRHAFLDAASGQGVSVLQSHLLIVDGRVDVQPQEIAPTFNRRILFTDDAGYGIYQTPGSRTLYDAATQLAEALAPGMALNLDMGSYDYCQHVRDGEVSACGMLGRDDTAKLSNLLVLTLE